MDCFNKDYSKFYDLLYQKKKYKKEFLLIKSIIKKYLKKPETLVDLGCGTGKYSDLIKGTTFLRNSSLKRRLRNIVISILSRFII